MKTAGIGLARQQLSKLLEEVKQGREIILTEHGRPVARLAPLRERRRPGFPDLARFRARMPLLQPPLSDTILAEREE